MTYLLGVDGGGSKTHALLLDECGRVLGFGAAGCGNHQVYGLEAAEAEIERAVRQALHRAGGLSQPVDLAYFCLSGADLPGDYALLTDSMHRLGLARTFVVKNDTLAAMRAALTRPWGVAVVCGSGLNAAGRSPTGQEFVYPSLGAISGDWGGGSRLSMEIIRLVMRAWDGRGGPTLLTGPVLAHFGAPSEPALIEALYYERIPPRQRLDLVPLLFAAAEAGDEPARQLVIQLGEEVALTANAILRRLGMQHLDVEVGLAGGVFRGQGPLLLDTITRAVHQLAPAARILRTRSEPVVGAALLALEAAGFTVDPTLASTLESTFHLPGEEEY